MPRPLVVSNGTLYVALDANLDVRELTWPHVGMPNHLAGHRGRIGVWTDDGFAWLADAAWEKRLAYVPGTLVTDCRARHGRFGLELTLRDCVLHRADVLLRRITVCDLRGVPRSVRLFFAYNFYIAETDIGDTALYNPFCDAMVHFKLDCYLLMGGEAGGRGIHQYATGSKALPGAEGTWRDAEDGQLSMNPITQGAVDSVYSLQVDVPASQCASARAWICAGRTMADVARLNESLRSGGSEAAARDTERYWVAWSGPHSERAAGLPEPLPDLFRRSLLLLRANIDRGGAIIAANDSDIMVDVRAHYSYVWPRDGALVAAALDRLNYPDITRKFFEFCREVLPEDRGALMHKYAADGSWGATWHPWVLADGSGEVPFQEDGTALTLWALWKHYERYRDLDFLESLYDQLVLRCGRFMLGHREPSTGLPLPSYDLWEERRGIHAYTCGTVYGALSAAAAIADVFGDRQADRFREGAEQVRAATARHMVDPETGIFGRMLRVDPRSPEMRELDRTLDSSVYGLWAFGAFGPRDAAVEATMRAVTSRLWVKTDVGGLARYEDDYYHQQSNDIATVPGNPWFICTLWAAQWHIAAARTRADLQPALDLMQWAAARAMPSGAMPEQLHPYTGAPLSVSPLTWSHAEFVVTSLDYLDRLEALSE